MGLIPAAESVVHSRSTSFWWAGHFQTEKKALVKTELQPLEDSSNHLALEVGLVASVSCNRRGTQPLTAKYIRIAMTGGRGRGY